MQATRIEFETFKHTFENAVTLHIFQDWFIILAHVFEAYNAF